MATQFRQLGPADAEELATHLVAWQRRDGSAPDPALIRREVPRILADSHRWHAWLIQAGDEVAGYLVLNFGSGRTFEAPRATLGAFYLRPERREGALGLAARRFIRDVGHWLRVQVTVPEPAREDRHLPAITLRSQPAVWTEQYGLRVAV